MGFTNVLPKWHERVEESLGRSLEPDHVCIIHFPNCPSNFVVQQF